MERKVIEGNLQTVALLVILALVASCAAHSVLGKASVAADVNYKIITASRSVIAEMKDSEDPTIKKAYKEAAKAWNTAHLASLAYVQALQTWAKLGDRPTNYEAVVMKFVDAVENLSNILKQYGLWSKVEARMEVLK